MLNEVYQDAWTKMMGAKCQYCKHFEKWSPFLVERCNLWVVLLSEKLMAQECHRYEWRDWLTKEDFADDG